MNSQPNLPLPKPFSPPEPALVPNPLRLIPAPYQAKNQGRSRFLFVGDATQPVTELTVDPNISSRYQMLRAADLTLVAPFRLKILHFNDLHGRIAHLAPEGNIAVFSRLVSRYRQQQQKYAHNPQAGVLLLSAGDDMVGTPFDALVSEGYHPYDLYQTLGVDAAALGNHDLDLGTQAIAKIIQRSGNFPLLSANLRPPQRLKSCIYPAALLDVQGVRVGIIGLTTPAQMKGSDARNLTFSDPVQVVKNLLPLLRPYCHVLIILSHLGYDLHSTSAAVVGYGDRQLAAALPHGAVDLIIGGHTHHILNETGLNQDNIVNGIPIVQAGTLGRFLGEVTITLQGDHPAATVTNAKLWATADLPVDQTFEKKQIMPIVASLHQKLNHPLGIVIDHVDLGNDAVLNDFASRESAFANFITAGMLTQAQAQGYAVDLALTDAAVLRTGLPPDTFVYGDWFAVMPHADTLRFFQITGQQLLMLLQDNAQRANRPGEPHLERGFVQFSRQIRYKIQLGKQRQASRATAIFVNGRPLEEQLAQTFTFVTHSFIRQAACHWERQFSKQNPRLALFNLDTLPSKDTELLLRDVLIAHIKAYGGVTKVGGVFRDGRLVILEGCGQSLVQP
ncbi:bifunctional UDP-sugar hydrolase/5'-nucleotidase [Picosynechococcus sp. NKBG15041c]|uniref:bifunctional metallophosphatase/5'-nucleotidase n=1 Tax=Picosynechococcus sp. NKBG15041c TaxID=1407650 RepID=UPI0004000E3A|nr:bifunctional UDP-sugar hydrolase/5'-nucleotidase [Picosynechococcus sp. NKBG15041c]